MLYGMSCSPKVRKPDNALAQSEAVFDCYSQWPMNSINDSDITSNRRDSKQSNVIRDYSTES